MIYKKMMFGLLFMLTGFFEIISGFWWMVTPWRTTDHFQRPGGWARKLVTYFMCRHIELAIGKYKP